MYTLLWVELGGVLECLEYCGSIVSIVGGIGVLECMCTVYSSGWALGGVLKSIEYTL